MEEAGKKEREREANEEPRGRNAAEPSLEGDERESADVRLRDR